MGWTLAVSKVARSRHYLKWKVVCTSDGNAMAATDLIAQTGAGINELQGSALMMVKAVPGSGDVIPDADFDFTLSDDEDDAILTITDSDKDAAEWHDASIDIGMYPAIFGKLYLAFPTAADWTSGDQCTLYFINWIEDK